VTRTRWIWVGVAVVSWIGLPAAAGLETGRSSGAANAPKEVRGSAASPEAVPEGGGTAVWQTAAQDAGSGTGFAPGAAVRTSANDAPAAPGAPAGGSGTPAGQAPAKPRAGGTGPRGGTGLLATDSNQPISIKADELEAVEKDGRRHLLFNRSVHVEQGDLVVHSDRLEAFYAANASQPERLVATGHVRVRQRDRNLACQTAVYFPGNQRLECTGDAALDDGDNHVRGDRIEILFAEDRILVKGGATVNVTPDASAKGAGAKAPGAAPGAPADAARTSAAGGTP
jgi:lipopolysaccharide transport protein LptA